MEQRNSIFSDVFVAVAVAVVVAEALYSRKISQSLIYIYVAEMNTSNIHRGNSLCCYKHPNKMRVLMITWILYVRMLLVMMFAACV